MALGAGLVAALALLFARSEVKAEIVVGVYWLSFCLYETVLHSVSIPGFFYPFYAAFLLALIGTAIGPGVRFRPSFFWLQAAFLLLVASSFVGFMEPVNFEVVQRVLAFLMAPLLYLQFRSARGVGVVGAAAVVSSLVLGVWVVISAVEGGFAYRGDVEVNENTVAFYVSLGFVIAACAAVHALGTRGRRSLGFLLLLTSGFIGYALLLLASRGVAIAVGLALIALLARIIAQDRGKLVIVVLLVAALGLGLLLPGGQGLLERFQGERVESGGSRVPIWTTVLDSYTEGNPRELLLGFGFDSSKDVVQRGFGTLTSTHNAYLQILYEFGAVGLTLFLALHIAALVVAWRRRGPMGLAMFSLVWLLLGVNASSTAPDGFLYWVALALILAIGTWGGGRPLRLRARGQAHAAQ